MKHESTGWAIINIGHPATGWVGMARYNSFRRTKRDCIAAFVEDSGNNWNYWKSKYNFRCVKAKQVIETL